MNNLLKKIDESIEFNSKERPHLPEINIGLYIAREIIQGEQKRKRPICKKLAEYEDLGLSPAEIKELQDQVEVLTDTVNMLSPLMMENFELKKEDREREYEKHTYKKKHDEVDSLIKQAIDNCFMTHKYEYPGMERGLCAGLRKQNGEGEPTEVCKECKFNYIWEEENQN